MIIVVANITLQISRILVRRPILRWSRGSVQIVGLVVDVVVDAVVEVAVVAVADTKVTARSGKIIISMEIEMIMEIVFKRGSMIGCDIFVFNILDVILTTLTYFMLLGSVILAFFPFQMTMTIGS